MEGKSKFKDNVKIILSKLGLPEDKIDLFLTGDIPLRKIGICIRITDIIDDYLKQIYPNYDGCTSYDTFNVMYDFNFNRKSC